MYSLSNKNKKFNIKNYIKQIDFECSYFKEVIENSKKHNSKINIKSIEIETLFTFSIVESINMLKNKVIKYYFCNKTIHEYEYFNNNFFSNVMTNIFKRKELKSDLINGSTEDEVDISNSVIILINLMIIHEYKTSIFVRIIKDYLLNTNDSSLVENIMALSNNCKRDNINIEIYKYPNFFIDLDYSDYKLGFLNCDIDFKTDSNENKYNPKQKNESSTLNDNYINLIKNIEFNYISLLNYKECQNKKDLTFPQKNELLTMYKKIELNTLLEGENDYISTQNNFKSKNSNNYKEFNLKEVHNSISALVNENNKKTFSINMCLYYK